MSNLLLIQSNPRKNGYSQHLIELFLQGMRESGATVTTIDLCCSNIHHCKGCYRCWLQTPGQCVFKDDMQHILEQYHAADRIVLATPLYAFTVSTDMKAFMDRTLCLTKPGFEQVGASTLTRNQIHHTADDGKKFATIAIGAFKGDFNFDGISKTFEMFIHALHGELIGQLIRPESYLMQFNLAKPKTIKTIEAAFIKAGFEFATQEHISTKSITDAATPLSVSDHHFLLYSNIYWEHALAMGTEAFDLEKVQRVVTTDVRILMNEMARSIDPVATARLKAVFQFDFPDKPIHYRITVTNGTCVLEEAQSTKPDLRVRCDTTIWAGIFMREVNVKDALINRQIILEGDKSLFSRLDRFFPPPIC